MSSPRVYRVGRLLFGAGAGLAVYNVVMVAAFERPVGFGPSVSAVLLVVGLGLLAAYHVATTRADAD